MCKRLCLLTSFVLLLVGVPVFGDVGIFDFTDDIGDVGGYGVTYTVPGSGQYEILAAGSDIWGSADQFHYAYNQVSGNIRFALGPAYEVAPNHWSKIETMFRVDDSPGSIAYATAVRRGGVNTTGPGVVGPDKYITHQIRDVANAGMYERGQHDTAETPSRIAVQRIVSNGYQLVQSLVDFGGGSGWELVDTQHAGNNAHVQDLPDTLLLGAAVTSHQNDALVRAIISDPAYTENPGLVGIPTIGDPLPEACGNIPGFLVKVAQNPDGTGWPGDYAANYEMAEYLVKNEL